MRFCLLFLALLSIILWMGWTIKHKPLHTHTCHHSALDYGILNRLYPSISRQAIDSIFQQNPQFHSDGFDFPVGKPDGENYYKALEFGQKYHLGEDWNGVGGGNTDLGDSVYNVANGLVTFAEHLCCGWGNVVRVVHRLPDSLSYRYVETIYAHLDKIKVAEGQLLSRGEQVGTIGTADGKYFAHLHFELRDFLNMSIGQGYSRDQHGYLAPTPFIRKNRPNL